MSKTKTDKILKYTRNSMFSLFPLFVLSMMLVSFPTAPGYEFDSGNVNADLLLHSKEESFTLVNLHITAFLQGPFSSATNTMSDALRSGNVLPSTDPYTESPVPVSTTAGAGVFAVTNASNAIVDWVLVELRDASTPTTILGSKSALIQRDGNIVAANDGVSDVQFLSTDLSPTSIPGSVFVVIKHRNHLAIRSATALSTATGTITHNFTTGQSQAIGTNPMASLNAGNTLFGMWGGNVNGDTRVRYTNSIVPVIPSDAIGIYNALGGIPSGELLNVYNANDVNMDRNVRYTNKIIPSIPSDAIIIYNFLSGNSAGQANQGF